MIVGTISYIRLTNGLGVCFL